MGKWQGRSACSKEARRESLGGEEAGWGTVRAEEDIGSVVGNRGGFYSFAQEGCLTVSLLKVQNRALPWVTLATCRLSSLSLTRVAR